MLYKPKSKTHKGDNGRILIIAGSSDYHGSALLSIKAAIPFVDIVYYYLPDGDKYLMQAVKQIPEVIVVRTYDKVLDLIRNKKIDAVLIGPGLSASVENVKLSDFKGIKRIFDADAFKFIDLNKLDNLCLLTPHKEEFRMLFSIEPTENNVFDMARKYKTNILVKGYVDFISNGKTIVKNKFGNAGMTKGGTGDALAGFITTLASKNDLFLSAQMGVKLFCKAGDLLYKKKKYYYTPSEIIGILPEVMARFI